MHFADYIQDTVTKNSSVIVAGFDPVLPSFPDVFINEASKEKTNEDSTFRAITSFYSHALSTLSSQIAAIKPNIAFFEQYGIGGMRALQYILQAARDLKVPTILDAKRGDIGTTAEAYARAYLSRSDAPFNADSLTVNPFLGFDTVKVFLDACIESGKGIFILVKTSNPGSVDLQDRITESGHTVSHTLASWIEKNSSALMGSCGVSGVGAVVGATHPKEMNELRAAMPSALFLVPGMGAQGGTAADVIGGFTKPNTGALINLSRGLLSSFSKKDLSKDLIASELNALALKYNGELGSAMQSRFGASS